jgi:hypothetical protein
MMRSILERRRSPFHRSTIGPLRHQTCAVLPPNAAHAVSESSRTMACRASAAASALCGCVNLLRPRARAGGGGAAGTTAGDGGGGRRRSSSSGGSSGGGAAAVQWRHKPSCVQSVAATHPAGQAAPRIHRASSSRRLVPRSHAARNRSGGSCTRHAARLPGRRADARSRCSHAACAAPRTAVRACHVAHSSHRSRAQRTRAARQDRTPRGSARGWACGRAPADARARSQPAAQHTRARLHRVGASCVATSSSTWIIHL